MPQNAFLLGKRHDNKNLNLKFLLSRNFVVMAQAPIDAQNKQISKMETRVSKCAFFRSGKNKSTWGLFIAHLRRWERAPKEKQPRHKVFGRAISGISGTQTSGYPGQKFYANRKKEHKD